MTTVSVAATTRRTRRLGNRYTIVGSLFFIGFISTAFKIYQLQLIHVENESESPFDHAISMMLKPYYRIQCPKVSTHFRQNPVDCRLASTKMIMLNARDKRPEDSVVSWNNVSSLELYNTSKLTETYSVLPECKTNTWRSRLFAIYRHVFRDILTRYPNESEFLIFEDDAILHDQRQMERETCMAITNKLDFYSFYTTPTQGEACTYEYGTVGFFASRAFIQRLADVDQKSFCRLGIDIYIASIGPWFASVQSTIQHNAKRFGEHQLL